MASRVFPAVLVICALSSVSCAVPDDASVEGGGKGLTSCNYPSTLEITSVNVGQGDATIIATPTSLVLADMGESYWSSHADAVALDAVLTAKYGCRNLDLVIISHFQTDHIGYVDKGGLWYLVNMLGYTVEQTLIRDLRANVGTTSGTYDNWRAYLDRDVAQLLLNPRTPAVGERLDLGAGIRLEVTNVDTRTVSCPGGWGSASDLSCGGAYVTPSQVLGDHRGEATVPDENDYCLGFVVSVGDFDMYIGGDTNGESSVAYGVARHDIESYLARDVGEVDVLRVNHHGSHHSSNSTFVSTLGPQAAVISVGNDNTYGHSRQVAIDRLLGVVENAPTRELQLYMTERGDDGGGGCIPDHPDSPKAAAELYGRATIVSDLDGDYCTVEGGNVDIVVSADGATFTVEGDAYTSAGDPAGPTCGDGSCDNNEDSQSCPADCAPPAAECGNGSCEAGEDCQSCPGDCPAPPAQCGNGVCETADSEDCLSCPADCAGRQDGKPSKRFCCGSGGGINPVGCDDARCTSSGLACISVPATASCGGGSNPPPPACDNDGVCDAGEDCGSCPGDCASRATGKKNDRFCCGNGTAEPPELADGALCDGNL